MDLQKYIQNAVLASRQKTLANSDQLTLGEMILKVEHLLTTKKGDESVVYDFGYLFPTEIDSWRGSYSELALDYKTDGNRKSLTDFCSMLKGAVGKEFTGYKGGEFIMNKNTPVWVSNYGESSNTAVIDVVDGGYQILIITGYREY